MIDLQVINHLMNKKEYGKAFDFCIENLNDNPESAESLALAAESLAKADNPGVAIALFESALRKEIAGKEVLWNALGRCWADLGYETGNEEYVKRGVDCYQKALEINPNQAYALNNLCIVSNHNCTPDTTIRLARQALRALPEMTNTHYNMALAQLMKGDWVTGWRNYDLGIEGRIKKKPRFNLPLWNGHHAKKVVTISEQGLGDVLMFCSMLPDFMQDATPVIECEKRLENLIRRSFGCETHGTRFEKDRFPVDWFLEEKCDAEYYIPMGSLGNFYRLRDEDFPGTPYLKPHPDLCVQYRALLDSLGDRPKIGLAWTGGFNKTLQYRRSLGLRELAPILSHDADFISLQYKNPPPEGSQVIHWSHILDNEDYDHTAALVSQLDLVITVTTTMAHLTGALGKECWVMVPDRPQWRYLLEGNKMPWYNSVELFRQKEGIWPIQDISERLSRMGIEKIKKPSMSRRITVSRHSNTDPRSPESSTPPEQPNSLTTERVKAV